MFSIIDTKPDKDGKLKITVGNIGDSRCLLGRKSSKLVELTQDHKPNNKIELERIVSSGGSVSDNRVNGSLAMSRALGDRYLKENKNLPDIKQAVIAVPDITTDLLSPEDFLLICCDGIFERLSNQGVIEIVSKSLKKTDDLALVMSDLLDASLSAGSKDNMTGMIILNRNGTSYHQEKDEFIPGDFYENDKSFKKAYEIDCLKNGFTLQQALKWRIDNKKST